MPKISESYKLVNAIIDIAHGGADEVANFEKKLSLSYPPESWEVKHIDMQWLDSGRKLQITVFFVKKA